MEVFVMKSAISIPIFLLAMLSILPGIATAYEGDIEGLGGDTHNYLAYDVFAVDSLKPYFNELIRYGNNSNYTYSNWAKHSNWEPDPQHGWGYVFSSSLYNFNLNDNSTGWNISRGGTTTGEFTFGALLHALADSAVPAVHDPVAWEYEDAHDYWESQAVSIVPNYASIPSPTEYLQGDLEARQTALEALKIAYVADYQNWWYNVPPYPTFTELQYTAAKTMQIAADASLKQYFDNLNLLTPNNVIADWTFDEGDSATYGSDHQYIYTHRGSTNANLVRGWTHGADLYDGTWDSGYDRTGAFRGKLLSENSGGQTYCKSFNWTGYEGQKLTPQGSFSIELIVNPDSIPASDAVDNDNPSSLINFYDASGNTNTHWYFRGFRKINVGGILHDAVSFGMETRDGGGFVDLFADLTANGITPTPGKWYYLAVDYYQPVSRLKIMVRDLATGQNFEQSTTCNGMVGMALNSQPMFLVGGESDDSDLRPFDGKIDRLRICNNAVGGDERLYNNSTIAYWKFNENTGQLVQNTTGSSTADLQFGSSTSSDTSDPTWTTGLYNYAMKGKKYTVSNKAIYAKDTGWTLRDKEKMSPGNSYSIETIVNPTSYATSGTWNNVNPMGIVKYKDSASGGKTMYNIQTFTDNDLRHKVRFYGEHADGTYTDYIFDPQAAGLTINTGTWYYIAAIYTDNDGTGTLELVVRNMSTGAMVSGTTSSKRLAAVTTTPSTTLLIGSEYSTSSGRCFDGKIDEVRISNRALSSSDRLYSISH
jgi:hypothetical protein